MGDACNFKYIQECKKIGITIAFYYFESKFMKIAIIWASNWVWLETVKRALERWHEVVSLSRSIEALPQDSHLQIIKGSVLDPSILSSVILWVDVVLVTLWTGMNMKSTTLYTDAAQTIIDVWNKNGLETPCIIVTWFGAWNSQQYQWFFIRNIMKLMLWAIYKNKTQMEEILSNKLKKYEFVRPWMLTAKGRTENYKIIVDYTKDMKVWSISRADVADYLVKEAEQLKNLGKYPALTN